MDVAERAALDRHIEAEDWDQDMPSEKQVMDWAIHNDHADYEESEPLLESEERETADVLLERVASRMGIEEPLEGRTLTLPIETLIVDGRAMVKRDMAHTGGPNLKLVAMLHTPAVMPSQTEEGMFTVIAGKRRVEAAAAIGLPEIRCNVFPPLPADQAALIAFTENMSRGPAWIRDLEALVELVNGRTAMTEKEVAAAIGKPVSVVHELLAMTRLPETILAEIFAGRVNKGDAKRMTRLSRGHLDKLVDRQTGAEPEERVLTSEAINDAMRAQIGVMSAPLASVLDEPEEWADGSIEERDEASAQAILSSNYAVMLVHLRHLLRDATLSSRARALTTALISELE